MGVASSKHFVHRMLRNGFDDKNDDDADDDAQANLLLSLLVHHSIKQQQKKRDLSKRIVVARRRRLAGLTPPVKKIRLARRRFFLDPISGDWRPMTPKLSDWWVGYIQDPHPECRLWSKSFRLRFRLPYEEFVKLLKTMQEDDDRSDVYFRPWKTVELETNGGHCRPPPRKVSPIELLLLGTLRYLGRGWTFDDLEESTYISRDVHRCFFHKFCAWGAKVLYPMYLKVPKTLQDLRACEKEYSAAGFPGCVGSTDATHILLEKLSFGLRQGHLGYKMSSTARTYNLTVNHR